MIKTHYLEKVSATRVLTSGNLVKPMANVVPRNAKKRIARTHLKPVENDDFKVPFAEIAIRMIKKALPREGFRSVFSKRRTTL